MEYSFEYEYEYEFNMNGNEMKWKWMKKKRKCSVKKGREDFKSIFSLNKYIFFVFKCHYKREHFRFFYISLSVLVGSQLESNTKFFIEKWNQLKWTMNNSKKKYDKNYQIKKYFWCFLEKNEFSQENIFNSFLFLSIFGFSSTTKERYETQSEEMRENSIKRKQK